MRRHTSARTRRRCIALAVVAAAFGVALAGAAVTAPGAAAHGYGTRPPWVAAGVVRALALDGAAYVEVLVQQRGHLGARGPLGAPDTFRLVRLAGPREGAAADVLATPRWLRAPARRPLAKGDRTLAGGALAIEPLALAVAPRGAGFAVADHAHIALFDAEGDVRLTLPLAAVFGEPGVGEQHPRTALWPFDWLAAPPRALALFWAGDGSTLAVARRGAEGAWQLAALRAADGAREPVAAARAVLAETLGSAAAPEASIALEVLAEAALGSPEDSQAVQSAAEALLARRAGTLEARLLAARLVGDIGALLEPLRGGDGHPSMDDLLAAALLTDLAREGALAEGGAAPAAPALAAELVELALARGVPELFPAVAALGPAGSGALADAWVAVRAGRLSPYAEPRTAEVQLLGLLAEACRADAAPLAAWLGPAPAPAERVALAVALLAADPPVPEPGDGRWPLPDPRAALVRALGAAHAEALHVTGAATRALAEALCEALAAAQRAGDTAAVANAAQSLARTVDLPPERAAEPAGAAERWRVWWDEHGDRPQAAEVAAALWAGEGPAEARPRFGAPTAALGAVVDALLTAPGGAGWRALALGLEQELDRVDALGLRVGIEAALRQGLGRPLSADERAAEARVAAALGR